MNVRKLNFPVPVKGIDQFEKEKTLTVQSISLGMEMRK